MREILLNLLRCEGMPMRRRAHFRCDIRSEGRFFGFFVGKRTQTVERYVTYVGYELQSRRKLNRHSVTTSPRLCAQRCIIVAIASCTMP
jgi:hypothetical protein